MDKKKILFIVDILGGLPFLCISWLLLIEDGSNPITMIPLIGLGLWVLIIIIIPFYAIGRAAKEAKQKKLADSMLKKRPDNTVYQATTVIFEETEIHALKRTAGLLGIMVIPMPLAFLCIILKLIFDMEVGWLVLIFSVLFLVAANVFLLYWLHKEENRYKNFIGYPQQYCHEVSVEFDLNTPGKLFCKFSLQNYHTEQLKEIMTIQYNAYSNVLVCLWGEIRPRDTYRGFQHDALAITLTQPQSEELYHLLRENRVYNIKDLSQKNANYILKAIGDRQ